MLAAETYHKSLGIRNFISCTEIQPCLDAAPDWRETPDDLFFDRVLEVLQHSDRPQFVFTGTIRQHSPHVMKFPQKAYKEEVMREYRRRLELSSKDARAFIEATSRLPRPTIVLMFGDHVPADIVAAFEEKDFVADSYNTFFNIYDSDGKPQATELMSRFGGIEAVNSAFLDVLILQYAGFRSSYIDAKLQYMSNCAGRFCDASTLTQHTSFKAD